MPKVKNTAFPARLKRRIHLNISQEVYDKIKELGINASEWAENAFIRLISDVENMQSGKEAHIFLISQNKAQNGWIRGDSNTRTSPCEGDVIPLDHESKNQKKSAPTGIRTRAIGLEGQSHASRPSVPVIALHVCALRYIG